MIDEVTCWKIKKKKVACCCSGYFAESFETFLMGSLQNWILQTGFCIVKWIEDGLQNYLSSVSGVRFSNDSVYIYAQQRGCFFFDSFSSLINVHGFVSASTCMSKNHSTTSLHMYI